MLDLVMRGFSRVNVLLRKFPSAPSVASTMRKHSGRPSLIGTPYQPMDRFACRLIVISALLVPVALVFSEAEAILAWVMVGGPVSVGVACLIARMVNRPWFSRIVALLYTATCLGVSLAYAAAG